MNKLLVITGPTATGKTALGIHLAQKFNGEIVSGDSRQVYKFMDIGTGKDKDEYLKSGVKVWGIDLVAPDYNFNVSDYVDYASKAIQYIQSRGKLPILVGGTILYIKSLLSPFDTINVPPNQSLRKHLANYSTPELQKELQRRDPEKWQAMNDSDKNNPRRLIRAVEVITSDQPKKIQSQVKYDVLILSLGAPLDYLYPQIDIRVEQRIDQGAVKEVHNLLKQGYSFDLPSLTATGYKEFKDYLLSPDRFPLAPCVQQWKFNEHSYARRQVIFIKKFIQQQENRDCKVVDFDISQTKRPQLLKVSEQQVCKWYDKK